MQDDFLNQQDNNSTNKDATSVIKKPNLSIIKLAKGAKSPAEIFALQNQEASKDKKNIRFPGFGNQSSEIEEKKPQGGFFNEFQTKKEKFESFLTYRKRLSRLALCQSLYFHEVYKNEITETADIFEDEVNEVYRVIIFFYKKMFFINKYGDNKKNKKLEERFVRNLIISYISNKEKVDGLIKKYLQKKWRIERLNTVLRASLRAAICEAMFGKKISYKIIVSEYTSLVSSSVMQEKEVAFFNAVLDNILKEINS